MTFLLKLVIAIVLPGLAAQICLPVYRQEFPASSPAVMMAPDDLPQPHSSAEIESTVENVLAHPEYRHLLKEKQKPKQDWEWPDWLKKFLKWLFGEPKERKAPSKPFIDVGALLYYLALVILVVVLILLAASLFRWIQRPTAGFMLPESADAEAIMPTRPAGDLSTNEYEQRALAAIAKEDYRAALRELVLGSMSWTERAELIRYRRGLTNRDYIRAVWRNPAQRESLLKIVLEFERVFYGHRQADAATVDACLNEFRQSFLQEAKHALLAD